MGKRNRKKFSLKEEYKKSWEYIKDSRNFIYVVMILFFVFLLVGFFVPAPQVIQDKIMDFIKELLEQTKNMSQSELIRFIILNNVKSTFFGIALGIFFGIYPVVGTIVNGYLLGFVSLLSVNNGGIITLLKLFPHGIFELPAVFIALGLGLKLGTFIFKKDKSKSFKEYLINSIRIFFLIILPLLILAGIIEGSLIVLGW